MSEQRMAEGEEKAPPEPDAEAPNAEAEEIRPAETEEGKPEEKPPEPSPQAAATPPAYRPSYVFLAVVAIVTLGLDLGTKAWAVKNLDQPFERVDLIRGYLGLTLAHNRGGAWGLLQNESEAIRRPFFVLVSVVAIAFIVSLYRKLAPGQWALKWGLPLVLGGALGNLVDRIRYGHVIDFIDMYAGKGGLVDSLIVKFSGPIREYHWPTYNIADVAIVAGVILMAVDMFTSRKKKPKAAVATP
jgi:signal peptidase II